MNQSDNSGNDFGGGEVYFSFYTSFRFNKKPSKFGDCIALSTSIELFKPLK